MMILLGGRQRDTSRRMMQ
jgi:molecular chaperone DnaJ